MTPRNAVLAVALAFGIWEATDIPDTGAPAVVFAVLFVACAVWLRRRRSTIAAGVVGLLCTVEATQAHTWKDAGALTKDAATALGTAGILAALAYVVTHLRRRQHELSHS
ncbi:MAG TPA: hypothetical protein VFA30_07445 [Gaiellaceae bacterium]|nr:hypothetical protein [Gaiellaceae bacterium]